MIKLKVNHLLALAQSGLLEKYLKLGKPVAKYFCNRRFPAQLNEELDAFDKARNAVFANCGATVKDGKWQVPDDRRETCDSEMLELLGKELTFEAVPIDVADVVGCLCEAEMAALEPFLIDNRAK